MGGGADHRQPGLEGTRAEEPRIIFLKPWVVESWQVIFQGPYANDRRKHVRVRSSEDKPWPNGVTLGSSYGLGPPRREEQAVMRNAQDLFVDEDGVTEAHLPVQFGPRQIADFRLDTEGRATTGDG